jgi:hypothetical protein
LVVVRRANFLLGYQKMLEPITLKSGDIAMAVRLPELRLAPFRVVRDDRTYQAPTDRGDRFAVKVELSAEDAEQIRSLEARVRDEAVRVQHSRPDEAWKSNLKDGGSAAAACCMLKVSPRTRFWAQQRLCPCPADLTFTTARGMASAGLLWHMGGHTGVSLELRDVLVMGTEGPACPFSEAGGEAPSGLTLG